MISGVCGAKGDRTPDLRTASATLSQLSYGPEVEGVCGLWPAPCQRVFSGGRNVDLPARPSETGPVVRSRALALERPSVAPRAGYRAASRRSPARLACGPCAVLLALACVLGSLGCARREAPAPLTLDGLASERFEPGGRVVMRADGVEPSVEGRVRFEGTLYRPGERPASVDAQAPASAPRRGEIEWVMTPRLLRDIGGRGTFAGRIEVELAAPGGGARRAGTLPVRVDILGDDARERPLAVVRHEQEARALASKLGLTLGVADAGLAGLEVETVAPHSTAAAAGRIRRILLA